MLKKAGFDAATATKYASDSVIALGLATGNISTKQIEQGAELMTDIEKRAGSEAIKNFLDSLGTENKLKESLLGIVPTLLAMGATTKDIENILGNSELTKSFVDPLATAEQKAERIQKYLDAVRKGEAIDIDAGSVSENKKIHDWIKNNLEFTQLINEYNYSWVHVSYDQKNLKKQCLVIK